MGACSNESRFIYLGGGICKVFIQDCVCIITCRNNYDRRIIIIVSIFGHSMHKL